MNAHAQPLRFAFFEDFADPTLLFMGDAEGIAGLRDVLLALSLDESVVLGEDARFQAVGADEIRLTLVSKNSGLRYSKAGHSFDWSVTSHEVQRYVLQLEELARSSLPGHQYLESDSPSEFVVKIAKDEYPSSFAPAGKQ